MPPVQPPEISARTRRLAKPWRIAFIGYTLALTVGTHWPKLELPPEAPMSDKAIHLAAFGALTVLLLQTHWVRCLWRLGLIVMAWAAIDELTQGLPGLNRHVSIHDFAANAMGGIIALAWLWTLRPIGIEGGANRMRLRVHQFIFEELFAERQPWLAAGIGALSGALLVGLHWLLMPHDEQGMQIAITIAMMLSAFITGAIWIRLWQKKEEQLQGLHPCLSCGAAAQESGRCSVCGAATSGAAWIRTTNPPRRMLLRIAFRPALLAGASLIAGFAILLAIPMIYGLLLGQSGTAVIAPRLARAIGTLPPELTNAVDLTAYLLLFAAVARVYRAGLARFHDRSAICLQCGHDLRGTPVDADGVGRCGECGTPFVRTVELKPRMNTNRQG